MTSYVYLAGPIWGDDDPRSWRELAATRMPEGWEALDPLKYEVDYSKPLEIVKLDYGLIRKASVIVANVCRPSWGTAMELAYAKRQGKHVLGFGITDELTWNTQSPWLRAHVTQCLPTLDEALEELHDIANKRRR